MKVFRRQDIGDAPPLDPLPGGDSSGNGDGLGDGGLPIESASVIPPPDISPPPDNGSSPSGSGSPPITPSSPSQSPPPSSSSSIITSSLNSTSSSTPARSSSVVSFSPISPLTSSSSSLASTTPPPPPPDPSSNSTGPSISFTFFTTVIDGQLTTVSSPLPTSLSTAAATGSTGDRTSIIVGTTSAAVFLLLCGLGGLFFIKRSKLRQREATRVTREVRGLLEDDDDDHTHFRSTSGAPLMSYQSNSLRPSIPSPSHSQSSSFDPYAPQHSPAPSLFRARASDSGSIFREDVWPPPNQSPFVDPFVGTLKRNRDVDLGSIVDSVMGPSTSNLNLPLMGQAEGEVTPTTSHQGQGQGQAPPNVQNRSNVGASTSTSALPSSASYPRDPPAATVATSSSINPFASPADPPVQAQVPRLPPPPTSASLNVRPSHTIPSAVSVSFCVPEDDPPASSGPAVSAVYYRPPPSSSSQIDVGLPPGASIPTSPQPLMGPPRSKKKRASESSLPPVASSSAIQVSPTSSSSNPGGPSGSPTKLRHGRNASLTSLPATAPPTTALPALPTTLPAALAAAAAGLASPPTSSTSHSSSPSVDYFNPFLAIDPLASNKPGQSNASLASALGLGTPPTSTSSHSSRPATQPQPSRPTRLTTHTSAPSLSHRPVTAPTPTSQPTSGTFPIPSRPTTAATLPPTFTPRPAPPRGKTPPPKYDFSQMPDLPPPKAPAGIMGMRLEITTPPPIIDPAGGAPGDNNGGRTSPMTMTSPTSLGWLPIGATAPIKPSPLARAISTSSTATTMSEVSHTQGYEYEVATATRMVIRPVGVGGATAGAGVGGAKRRSGGDRSSIHQRVLPAVPVPVRGPESNAKAPPLGMPMTTRRGNGGASGGVIGYAGVGAGYGGVPLGGALGASGVGGGGGGGANVNNVNVNDDILEEPEGSEESDTSTEVYDGGHTVR